MIKKNRQNLKNLILQYFCVTCFVSHDYRILTTIVAYLELLFFKGSDNLTLALAELEGEMLDLENWRNQTITQFLELLRQQQGCTFSAVI